jgi:CheY-like chemotaxis protein
MGQAKTILYAEDDPVVLTAYRMRLQRAGYHVVAVHDGLDAIKKLSTFVPDLVLLDLMMPKFNGDEVLQFILKKPALKKVPIIILSTNTIRDITHEPLLEQASKRLVKCKCTTAMLLDAVEEILEGSAPATNKLPELQRNCPQLSGPQTVAA